LRQHNRWNNTNMDYYVSLPGKRMENHNWGGILKRWRKSASKVPFCKLAFSFEMKAYSWSNDNLSPLLKTTAHTRHFRIQSLHYRIKGWNADFQLKSPFQR
jgi:hypothetical protein